jgi:glucosamine--fructose-6-phosphate aminotransferase (isomerizing)
VRELEALHLGSGFSGETGIAHTRWATHGAPSERNAHPIASRDSVAVVHNGIIENHAELRAELKIAGLRVRDRHRHRGHRAPDRALPRRGRHAARLGAAGGPLLRGAFAIAVVSKRDPGVAVGARRGSRWWLGLSEGEQFIASDIHALLPVTRRFIYLDEGDTAEIRVDSARVFDDTGAAVERTCKVSDFRTDAVERGEYKHYMLKEIHEQPQAVADTLEGRIAEGRVLPGIFGPDAEALFARTRAVHLIACGSSYHACLVARTWIESLAGIPATVEIASEYRYRDAVVPARRACS